MDTQKTVLELLATGLTQQELADLVPCSQSLIAAFANGTRGKQTSMQIGNSLLRLHGARCEKAKRGGSQRNAKNRSTTPIAVAAENDAVAEVIATGAA